MIERTINPSKRTVTNKVPEREPEPEPEPILEYNNKTEESYNKKFLGVPDRLDHQEKNFLNEVDVSKGDIEKKINTIVRIMAIDYDDPKKKRKEFMYWYENWYGKNWQGQSVPPVADHVEGIYQEQDVEPIIERNKKIGDRRVGQHEVYYIPFSKEKVDELIESSVGTEKETINYVVKTPTMRNGGYTYEQFVTSTFPECVTMMMKNGGPQLVEMEKQQQAASNKETKNQKEDVNVKPLDDTKIASAPPKFAPQPQPSQPQPHRDTNSK